MDVRPNERGFPTLHHPTYPPGMMGLDDRLVTQSSKIGDYPNAMATPGSSALWIGPDHHLNREEVAVLVQHLQAWLTTGCLKLTA